MIIPSTASYQDDCGAVSAYGLIYTVLRANSWLDTQAGKHHITIYYAYDDTKSSPNRCKPTSKDGNPTVNTLSSAYGTCTGSCLTDSSWTDGCDFSVSGAQPVKLIKNTDHSTFSTATTRNTVGQVDVSPQYSAVTIDSTVTKVNFYGGPFIISSANGDDATFRQLLDGSLIANDSDGFAIDFSPYRTPGTCTNLGDEHNVNVFYATAAFTALVGKQFTATPPRLALVATDSTATGTCANNSSTSCTSDSSCSQKVCSLKTSLTCSTTSDCTSQGYCSRNSRRGCTTDSDCQSRGRNWGTCSGVSSFGTCTTTTTGVCNHGSPGSCTGGYTEYDGNSSTGTDKLCDGILEQYLENAGIDYDGAQGCPSGGANINNPSICPYGALTGQIYDVFDFKDLVGTSASDNWLLRTSSGKPLYGMVWAPHWESNAGTSSAPNSNEQTVFAHIKAFLQQTANPSGLAAECASISTFEGAYQGGSKDIYDGLQLQTCKGTSTCSSTTSWGIDRNPSSFPTGATSTTVRGYIPNCADPNVATGKACVYFGAPGDPYIQTGDHIWNLYVIGSSNPTTYSHVAGFNPLSTTSSIYQPGVTSILSVVSSLDRTKLSSASAARSMVFADLSTRSIVDNTTGEGNVLYLSGHDESNSVAGTKVMLETLLQLGTTTSTPSTTTTEVSRGTPIAATISAQTAIVQGTFESVLPTTTPTTVTNVADMSAWTFPWIKGHMRARTAASISTTESTYSSGTVLFDAATAIPAVNNAGCSPAYQGTCRTIFTTTTAPSTTTGIARTPASVLLSDTNATALGALMVPSFGASDAQTFVHHILAGYPDGSGGFTAALGGVDRSTVAVIEASSFAKANRPKVAYFGADDGMVHAVCADTVAPCTTLGTELWAFIPRENLPRLRLNTARVDGSMRVFDAYGDFANTGTKAFHTLLTFQTGTGDPTTSGQTPAVYELDITDPTAPFVVFEYTIPNVSSRGSTDLGTGLVMASGVTTISTTNTNMVFAQTNNGGTGGAGTSVFGLNAETGAKIWSFGYLYPTVRTSGDSAVPATGIPGGAVIVDKTGAGKVTDLVFGDLYGDLWMLDPATGNSRYTSAGPTNKPLFSFSTDYHAIGALPAIYSTGGTQFAAFASGGYADPSDSTWGTAAQYLVSVSLSTPTASATISEATTAYVPVKVALGTGEKGYSQAHVVGNQVFVTTDSTDINASTYGTSGTDTGHVYGYDFSSATSASTVVVAGGAGSLANTGSTLYAASSAGQQQLSAAATSTTGTSVTTTVAAKLSRALWLRTQ